MSVRRPRKAILVRLAAYLLLFAAALPLNARNFSAAHSKPSEPFPYVLRPKTEFSWCIFSVSVGAGALALPLQQPLDVSTRLDLNSNLLNNLDRPFAGRYLEAADRRSDLAVYAAMAAAVCTPMVRSSTPFFSRAWTLGVLCAEANFATLSLTELSKRTAARARPLAYPGSGAPDAVWQSSDARASFFSGHSSIAACNAVFAATVWSDLHPHSKLKPWIWAGAIALPSYAAWQRVQAGKHFPTDVLVGLAVGATAGRIVPLIHRRNAVHPAQPIAFL